VLQVSADTLVYLGLVDIVVSQGYLDILVSVATQDKVEFLDIVE